MIGKYRDGGYAEFIVMPARSVFRLPEEIPFEQGAIMMCSSATSLHALNKARLRAGESVAVFGVGGLGLSAIQLAKVFGAREVFAVDIQPGKLALAERLRRGAGECGGMRAGGGDRAIDGRAGRGCGAGVDRVALDDAAGGAVAGHPGPRRVGGHH